MSDDVMSVMTPYPDVAQLAQGYMQRADGERLWVPLPTPSEPGTGVRFVIHLADGTVGFAGAGRCVQVADQGEGVDPAIRFEALLDSLQFDERSRPVYDYIVAVRAAALEAAQGEGEGYAVADDEVAAHHDASDPTPVPDATEEFRPQAPLAFEGAGEPDLPSVTPEPESSAQIVQTEELQAYSESEAELAVDAEIDFMEEPQTAEVGTATAEDTYDPALESAPEIAEDMAVAEIDAEVPDMALEPGADAGGWGEIEAETPAVDAGVAEEGYGQVPAMDQAAVYAQPEFVAAEPERPVAVEPGSSLPAPEPVKTGILTRPPIATEWRPVPGRRPQPQPASGLFEYARGGIPQPQAVPRPALDPAYIVQPAPHPRDFQAAEGNGAHAEMEPEPEPEPEEEPHAGGEVVNMSASSEYEEPSVKVAD